MKTDDLITILGTNVERVDRRQVTRAAGAALAMGGVAALAATWLALGVRPDVTQPDTLNPLIWKLIFTLSIVLLASLSLTWYARPGGERKTPIGLVAVPFVGIMLLAVVSLAAAPSSRWERMIVGDQWLECLLSIPIIAFMPFATVIWAVRQMAPTDLVRTGALCGLVAGGISATAYALHCTDDSVPFVALWYGGTIALCTLAGATLGPRLLRW